MKKNIILITLFGIFCALPALAGPDRPCNRDKVDLRSKNSDGNATEFLYENEQDYQNEIGYECDRLMTKGSKFLNSKCDGDAKKTMKPGHVWNGQIHNYWAIYDCHTSLMPGHDYWQEILTCEEDQVIENGKCVSLAPQVNPQPQPVKPTGPKVGDACSAADLKGRNASAGKYISNGKGGLACMASKCLSGAYMVYNNNVNQGWCLYPSKCPDGHTLNIIDGDKTDGKCTKVGGTSNEFVIITHDTAMGPDLPDWYDTIDVPDIIENNKKLLAQVDEDIRDSQNLRLGYTSRANDLAKIIKDTSTKFNDSTSDLKAKKWRNKDGKFNTARLASDGIAGVVLGTTAGLITAHVVKKGQIKNGYEDIKCTIAGQNVSDWGDELTVGVR